MHPYGYWLDNPKGWREGARRIAGTLLDNIAYRDGRRLQVADTDGREFLYRITSLATIAQMLQDPGPGTAPYMEEVQEKQPFIVLSKIPIAMSDAFENLTILCEENQTKQHDRFVPLSDHVIGYLRGARSGSWWSSLNCRSSELLRDRLALGVCRQPDFPVILRLNLSALTELSAEDWRQSSNGASAAAAITPPTMPLIPLETDAFDYPVFMAREITPMVLSGKTIDLSNFPNLELGHDEYIIHNVPVDCVDICAADHSVEISNSVVTSEIRANLERRTPRFWEAVKSFLNGRFPGCVQ